MAFSFKLPDGFLLGTATSATQIEGGDTNNSWYEWAKNGGVKDGSSPVRANNHYELYASDIELMAKMKLQIYRMSLEWSRIQPERDSFNMASIAHYREEIQLLKKKGIKVLVTLHHFTNPLWFENMGAFKHPESPGIFLEYVRYTVGALGDLVDEWITINEPNVYTVHGYFFGSWPPGEKGKFSSLQKVYTNMAVSHILSYREIHRIQRDKGRSETKIGFANHLRIFKAYHWWNPLHQLSTWFFNLGFQRNLTRTCMTGHPCFPILKKEFLSHGILPGRYYDFIGINYYTRGAVRFLKEDVFPNKKYNDLGWEIYPEGIVQCAKELYKKYRAPIYITENGTCDHHDSFRSKYIYDHLKLLCESGLPVERYYYWTFIDNFEWAEGEKAPFGLVQVDWATQTRSVRKSGEFFTSIIEASGVTEEMYETYVKKQ